MMKKRVLISVLLVCAIAFMSSAQVEHHVVKLGEFTQLSLVDNINVNYRSNPDSAGLAVFSCTKEVANSIIFSISAKGRLTIQVDDDYERLSNLPTITIYSTTLDEVDNSGDSTLRVSQLPPLKSFKVRLTDNGKVIVRDVRASKLELQILSGKGKIITDGSCDELAVRLIGTGEIQADGVKATTVSCRIMGTGSIGCNVDGGPLKVSGSGTGKVYYKGNPSKVTVRKLGTIKAIPMQ
ncbi:MAG: DUF2807 domain-containing protein [Muribaculaceae bacterium]|nr:DUF2807 domain-containing protein [Muribaculaceae bacterium]